MRLSSYFLYMKMNPSQQTLSDVKRNDMTRSSSVIAGDEGVQASTLTSRFLRTRSLPIILFQTFWTSSTTVSKCEVASYERVMKMLSDSPEAVGVYRDETETNLGVFR